MTDFDKVAMGGTPRENMLCYNGMWLVQVLVLPKSGTGTYMWHRLLCVDMDQL